MKNIFIIFGILLSYSAVFAQSPGYQDDPAPRTERLINSVGTQYLGVFAAQERGITERFSIIYGIGLHYSFFNNSTNPPIFGTRFINVADAYFGRPYSTQAVTPFLAFEVRSYNLARRAFRGHPTRANSANYLAFVAELPFASGSLINVPNLALAYPVGLKYGLRRALGRHLYAEGSLGALLKISQPQTSLQPRIDASVAWHW